MRLIQLTLGLIMLMLLGCSDEASISAQKKAKQASDTQTIRFVTINSPNTYYTNEYDQLAGLEYDLAKRFVDSLGPQYKLEVIAVDSFAKLIPALTLQSCRRLPLLIFPSPPNVKILSSFLIHSTMYNSLWSTTETATLNQKTRGPRRPHYWRYQRAPVLQSACVN